ncbi:MAG: aminotransferase class I/II-fold pyridoxal phosphate-dependent enzyme [Bacteroidetes bacterium]|jgi:methionine aminotransferase|nr:aminotransferase class I/II-fold pyridoxal phosphate-dependent enzyme [Bacteroidota bacterium]
MQINSKLPNIGTTIFTVMSALAREHNAINLSQGFPDFGCSPKLLELAQKHMQAGFNQYAPMQGIIQLRERIAEIIQTCYNKAYSPDTEITITAGATQGIYTSIAAFINKGDEVIVFEPAYDCYVPAIEVHGGIAVPIELRYPNFTIDWHQVKEKVNSKTKMIIINSPHNPSGTTLSAHDLHELESIVKGKNILVVSDEVYEHMAFDNQPHQSVARYKSLSEQSIIVSSFGKTVHTTGWKIGYVAAPKEIMTEFRKVHQFLVFAVNHPFQLALADYLADKATYVELKNFYQAKRDLFRKLISQSRFTLEPCTGTYFQLVNYKKISDEKDTEFAIRLTKENKLAAVPLSVFYGKQTDNKLLRFCFAKKDETLVAAAEIINKL